MVGVATLIVQLSTGSSSASPPSDSPPSTVSSVGSNSTTSETGSSASDASAPVPGRIPAACLGCTPEEQSKRQSSLDLIVTRLAAPRYEHCKDTTETFEDGPALARVGCSFPGSVNVDYALWANSADMAEFTSLFSDKADAVTKDWQLTGTSGPLTGKTIEFVENDQARFYWTYDKYLISGNAQYPQPDQERLNDWWRTSGALVAESS